VYHFEVAKRTSGFGLVLAPRDPSTRACQWLYAGLRGAILRGQLRPSARLPSTRELAAQYGVARGTVVAAFAQLESEGYINSTVGSGTYVNAILPDDLLQVAPPTGARAARPPRRTLSDYAARVTTFPALEHRPSRAFRANLPALDQFPVDVWAQLASRRLRGASTQLFLSSEILGYRPLREALVDYLATSRGVTCHADQVMIVAGVQEALDLVVRLVLNPGDAVCMEDPGYRGARQVFQAAGARITAVPVDDAGMTLRPQLLRRAKLIYLTPAHQYPLGMAMTLPRRLALLEAVRATSTLIFEDDYDSEYRYSGRPIPALHGLDSRGQVVFAGSFSKVLFPSMRLGYLVVPADLVERFAAARSIVCRHLPVLEQAIVCDFITGGHFGRHLRRMRELYAERLSVLVECARQQLAGALELSPIEAGLQTVGWLAPGISAAAVAEAARARNVEVFPLPRSSRGAMPRDGLQLGFAAVNPREIRRGVTELAHVLAHPARLR
jgi:GntR family transcriptional regulator / MocR family aminotransferase